MSHNRDENINKDMALTMGIGNRLREKFGSKNHQTLVTMIDTTGVSAKFIVVSLSDFLIHRGGFQQPRFYHVSLLLVEVEQSRINYPRLTGQDKNVELLGSLYSLWFSLRNRES